MAFGSSHVEAWESSRVEASGSSRVEARESSRVVAFGSSHVEASGSSRVEAWGQTTVHQKSTSQPELHGQAVCFLYDGCVVPLRKSDNATIIQVEKQKGVAGWLAANSVVETGGKVVLYKKVSKDYLTQEDTPNETSWVIGEVKTHPRWQPEQEECGDGKYHACARPYFCDEFRSRPGDRYVALQVRVEDLYAWPNALYPHKIAVREAVVLHECDRYGSPITTGEEVAA